MKEAKKYKIQILGETYSLLSDEAADKAAEMVDLLATEIAVESGITDTRKIIILTALKLASKVMNFEADQEGFGQRLADLIDKELTATNS